ncbi:hypothetical protein SUDANB130_00014 [Streptomyces sp. enrichment culture]
MSSTIPSWSTARHRYFCSSLILTKAIPGVCGATRRNGFARHSGPENMVPDVGCAVVRGRDRAVPHLVPARRVGVRTRVAGRPRGGVGRRGARQAGGAADVCVACPRRRQSRGAAAPYAGCPPGREGNRRSQGRLRFIVLNEYAPTPHRRTIKTRRPHPPEFPLAIRNTERANPRTQKKVANCHHRFTPACCSLVHPRGMLTPSHLLADTDSVSHRLGFRQECWRPTMRSSTRPARTQRKRRQWLELLRS